MDFIQKTKQLPQEIQEFFSSDLPRVEMKKSIFLYGLPGKAASSLAGPVGLIFIGDFFLRDLPRTMIQDWGLQQPLAYGVAYEINQRIFARFPGQFHDAQALLGQWSSLKSDPIISEDAAYRKVLEEEPWLIETKKEQEKSKEQLPQLFILDALAKYPRINDQVISEERIRVKSEKDMVRGSVRNWLRAYRDALGVRQHTAIERGQFLFHSDNGKFLSAEERERLSVILKSLDENAPVSVHPSRQEIVFPETLPKNLPDTRKRSQAFSQAQGQNMQVRPAPSQSSTPTSLPHQESMVSREASRIPASPPTVSQPQPNDVQENRASKMAPVSAPQSRVFNFSKSNQQSIPYDPSHVDDVAENQAIRFSSNHVLPVEKNHPSRIVPYGGVSANPSQPSPRKAQAKEVWSVPGALKNVVDLRSEE